MKNLNFKLILILITLISASGCKTYTVNCRPPKFKLYKNVNDIFPVYAKDFKLTVKNSLDYMDKITDSLDVTLQRDVKKLRQDLDQYSSRIETLTKSNYAGYRDGICDPEIRKGFQAFQNKLADMTLKISEITASLQESKDPFKTDSDKVNDAKKKLDEVKTLEVEANKIKLKN